MPEGPEQPSGQTVGIDAERRELERRAATAPQRAIIGRLIRRAGAAVGDVHATVSTARPFIAGSGAVL